MKLFLYSDKKIKNFLPLTYLRSFSQLRLGCFKIIDYFKFLFPFLKVEEAFEKKKEKGLYFLVRFLPQKKIEDFNENLIFKFQNQVVGYLVVDEKGKTKEKTIDGFLLENLWDLIRCQKEFFPIWQIPFPKENFLDNFSFKVFGNRELVFISKTAKILGDLILNTEKGPIIIDDDVILKGFNYLEGPLYIDKKTVIDNCKIRPYTTIGYNCRISGEIEASIFLDFANKHHEGFIGHAYIGEWVNLGAFTSNSDLKNNYSEIKVKIKRKVYNTKMLKFGCVIGDHTKTAIGTLIPTGAVFGICVNIKKGGPAQKFYPSFYWDKNKKWEFKKLVATIRKMMARREQTLTEEEVKKLKKIYEDKKRPL
uniref:Glucose-1-phosphate thymidylyltransferase n=1 Tax=candidate division WOR-3 bacterium TaxID=2052148 RepID=A0A7V3ZUU1_UNCW3